MSAIARSSVDFQKVKPNAEVPLVVDGDRFVKMFLQRVGAQPRKP